MVCNSNKHSMKREKRILRYSLLCSFQNTRMMFGSVFSIANIEIPNLNHSGKYMIRQLRLHDICVVSVLCTSTRPIEVMIGRLCGRIHHNARLVIVYRHTLLVPNSRSSPLTLHCAMSIQPTGAQQRSVNVQVLPSASNVVITGGSFTGVQQNVYTGKKIERRSALSLCMLTC